MTIKNLSDRLRIPRLGKIHLGIKAVNAAGKEYPKAVDYFVCADPRFQAVYPGEPRELAVLFPTDKPEEFASQYYRSYSRSRGLVCKGDGVKANRMIDADTGLLDTPDPSAKNIAWVDLQCPGRECAYYQDYACREVMNLQFLLPDVVGLGVWQLDTSSINSIINVNSALALLRSVVGHVNMVPLSLAVIPLEVTADGRKKKVWVLDLKIDMKLGSLRGQSVLPEPDDEGDELLLPSAEERATAAAEAQAIPLGPATTPAPAPARPAQAAHKPVKAPASTAPAPRAGGGPVYGHKQFWPEAIQDLGFSRAEVLEILECDPTGIAAMGYGEA
ncbi:MAG: hypothetical protein Q8R28_13870, partial [Dehalococcoidia bacterium]|nr:hypothetical protein [Dehalococcoidia bacterium]